jgi:hypothetical protein
MTTIPSAPSAPARPSAPRGAPRAAAQPPDHRVERRRRHRRGGGRVGEPGRLRLDSGIEVSAAVIPASRLAQERRRAVTRRECHLLIVVWFDEFAVFEFRASAEEAGSSAPRCPAHHVWALMDDENPMPSTGSRPTASIRKGSAETGMEHRDVGYADAIGPSRMIARARSARAASAATPTSHQVAPAATYGAGSQPGSRATTMS